MFNIKLLKLIELTPEMVKCNYSIRSYNVKDHHNYKSGVLTLIKFSVVK